MHLLKTTLAGARLAPGGSAANLSGVGTDWTLVLIDGFRQTNGPFRRMTKLGRPLTNGPQRDGIGT